MKAISQPLDTAVSVASEESSTRFLPLDVPSPRYTNKRKTRTVTDKLRMQGAPIDMIGSFLVAAAIDDASDAFRESLLLSIMERVELAFGGTPRLVDGVDVIQEDGQYYMTVNKNKGTAVIINLRFDGHKDQIVRTNKVARLDMHQLCLKESVVVTDDAQATCIHVLERLANRIEAMYHARYHQAKHKYGDGIFAVSIFPENGSTYLEYDGKTITGTLRLVTMMHLIQEN